MTTPDPRNPHDLPKPPKIGSTPTGPTEKAEWADFMKYVKDAFSSLKHTKDTLRHSENQRKAEAFRDAVNKAWREITTGKEEA